LKHTLSITLVVALACLAVSACGAKCERTELIKFAKIVESTKPQANRLINRFNALQKLKNGSKDMRKLAEDMAQLVVDMDSFLQPVKEMKPKSKDVQKLRNEYLLIWTSLQDAMKMALEVLITRDPRLAATLQDRMMEKNNAYFSNLQRFNSDYSIIMRRYGITPDEVGITPRRPVVIPFSPSASP